MFDIFVNPLYRLDLFGVGDLYLNDGFNGLDLNSDLDLALYRLDVLCRGFIVGRDNGVDLVV